MPPAVKAACCLWEQSGTGASAPRRSMCPREGTAERAGPPQCAAPGKAAPLTLGHGGRRGVTGGASRPSGPQPYLPQPHQQPRVQAEEANEAVAAHHGGVSHVTQTVLGHQRTPPRPSPTHVEGRKERGEPWRPQSRVRPKVSEHAPEGHAGKAQQLAPGAWRGQGHTGKDSRRWGGHSHCPLAWLPLRTPGGRGEEEPLRSPPRTPSTRLGPRGFSARVPRQ